MAETAFDILGVPIFKPEDSRHRPEKPFAGVLVKGTEVAIGVGTEVIADGIEKSAPASGLGQIATRLGATGTRVVGGAAAVVVGEVANSLITGGSGLLHRTAWAGAGDGVLFKIPTTRARSPRSGSMCLPNGIRPPRMTWKPCARCLTATAMACWMRLPRRCERKHPLPGPPRYQCT